MPPIVVAFHSIGALTLTQLRSEFADFHAQCTVPLRKAPAAFLQRSTLRETIKLNAAKLLLFSLFQIVPLSASHLGAIVTRARVISKESSKPSETSAREASQLIGLRV